MGKVFNYLHRCRGFQKAAAFLIAIAMTISMIPANNLILHAKDIEGAPNGENGNPNEGDTTVYHSNLAFHIGGAGGEVYFSVDGGATKYKVGDDATINAALENYAAQGEDEIIIFAVPKSGDIVTGFDCKVSGAGYFVDPDTANALRDKAKEVVASQEGYKITIPAGEVDEHGVEIYVDFGPKNDNNNNNNDKLQFRLRQGNGDIAFNVESTEGCIFEKTIYDGTNETITNFLKNYNPKAGDKITVWLMPGDKSEIDYVGYRIAGQLANEAAINAFREDALTEAGYTLTVADQDEGKNIEFEYEFKEKGNTPPPPGSGPNGNQPQHGVSWNTMNQQEDAVKQIAYKINDATVWTIVEGQDRFNTIGLSDGDKITIKYVMEEKCGISEEGLSVRYHYENPDDHSRDMQNDILPNMNKKEIAEALTSENGYTFVFKPSEITDSENNQIYDVNQTMVRIQFNVTKVFDTKNRINIFIQNEAGRNSNGHIIYGNLIEDGKVIVEGIASNEEIEFEFNKNRYGGQGIVGQTKNDGPNPISITYPSALEGKQGEMVKVTPDEYISFEAYGEIEATNPEDHSKDNEFFIDNELIDEIYIDFNHDGIFTSNEKINPMINMDNNQAIDGVYSEMLNPAESYNIFIRKHRSPVATIGWDYVDKNSDAYVNHGKIYIKKIVRNDENGQRVLVDGLHMNDDGTVALDKDGKPVYDTLTNDEGENIKIGISNSAGTIWALNGDIVTLLLVPAYGYQLDGAEVNGGAIQPLDTVSTFEVVLNGNLHFGSSFVKSKDVTKINTSEVSGVSIKNGENATDTGNLSLTVDRNDGYMREVSAVVKKEVGEITDNLLSLDLTLDNIISKGFDGEYWTNSITEFADNINVNIELNGIEVKQGEALTVVRDHNGYLEELECDFDPETGIIQIPTNKFSTYTIVKKWKPKEKISVFKFDVNFEEPEVGSTEIPILKIKENSGVKLEQNSNKWYDDTFNELKVWPDGGKVYFIFDIIAEDGYKITGTDGKPNISLNINGKEMAKAIETTMLEWNREEWNVYSWVFDDTRYRIVRVAVEYYISRTDGHIHQYEEKWTFDNNSHWHACVADGNEESCLIENDASKASHGNWDEDYKCGTCGYACEHNGKTNANCDICGKNLDGHPDSLLPCDGADHGSGSHLFVVEQANGNNSYSGWVYYTYNGKLFMYTSSYTSGKQLKPGDIVHTGSDTICTLNVHSHSWDYSVKDNAIIATCSTGKCQDQNTTATIGLIYSSTTYFDNLPKGAFEVSNWSVEDDNLAEVPVIKYVGIDGTYFEESDIIPTNYGKYEASITIDGAKTVAEFEIVASTSLTWNSDKPLNGKIIVTSIERGGAAIVGGTGMQIKGNVLSDRLIGKITDDSGYIGAMDGDTVILSLVPSYGYQVNSNWVKANGAISRDAVSEFEISLSGEMDISDVFVKTNDEIKNNSSIVAAVCIKNVGNAIKSGNARVSISDDSSYVRDISEAVKLEDGQVISKVASIEIDLENILSKGTHDSNWTERVREFDKTINVELTLKNIKVEQGEVISIVRDHEGKLEELECTFDSETGTIIFPTNKFSTYTVVKKSKPDKTVAVSKITIDPKSVLLKAKDETKTLKATIDPADATDKEVTWSSSDTSVVKVDEQGKLTAVANGKAVITVASKSDPKITAQCDVTVEIPSETKEAKVDVSYRTHVQGFGWQKFVSNGAVSGTIGESKRLESINICVSGNDKLGIAYTTHVQSIGWLPWSSDNEISGTTGESKRLEAIKIILKGEDSDKYDVYYRVHAQTYGWLAWAKNGASAGTSGMSKRLEAIQIAVVEKGKAIDENLGGIKSANTKAYIIGNSTPKEPAEYKEEVPNVLYRTHVQTIGWQNWMNNGAMAGTTGMSKRLEGINIKLTNCPYSGGIQYKTHIQTLGWEKDWKADGVMSGTSGQSKRLEAIQIELTGEMAKHYDVYYRVHAQTYGWLAWAKNGESAGTAGQSKRLEGIQIVLVKKGDKAPTNNYGGITSKESKAFLEK